MKKFFLVFFFGITLLSYGQDPFFSISKKVVDKPRMFQNNLTILEYTIIVKQANTGLGMYTASCQLNGRNVDNLRCIIDDSLDAINCYVGSDDSTIWFFQTQSISVGTHTIKLLANVAFKNSTDCPVGNLQVSDSIIVIGDNVNNYGGHYSIPIVTAELNSASTFCPEKLEKIDSTAFVKVATVKFSVNGNDVKNNKLIFNFLNSSEKKVKNILFVINTSDYQYKNSDKTIYLDCPDSLKVGDSFTVDVSFNFDSLMLNQKDSVLSMMELRSFDQCLMINELVQLPTLKIDQKSSSNVGVNITSFSNEVKIYPNPTTSIINISGLQKSEPIYIFDLSGRNILVSDQHQIDVSSLNTGTYFIQAGGIFQKFVKL
jgi:hypothetical protein